MFSLTHLIDPSSPLTVLDIGAALLESPPYQKFIDEKRARLIAFEPDVDACRRLSVAFGAPHQIFPFFVGDGGPAVFHETNWAPTGSLYPPNTELLQKFVGLAELVTPVAQHPVQTKRLDDLVEVNDVDFFKIDVQGGELAVFENATRALTDALLIQVEINFVELYQGQPLFSDVDAFLRQNGFQFHAFDGTATRPFKPVDGVEVPGKTQQVLWSDVYYVKDWMFLERLPHTKLVKLAVLLNDVVGSSDLAYRVLQEADRKSGGNLAEHYRQGLTGEISNTPMRDDPFFYSRTSPASIETEYGVEICVPPSLNSISTYVLLEQEKWFEAELGFLLGWLSEGMNAIDVGANLGVFSLSMAKRVGEGGRVFAYEPGSANRAYLEAGLKKNGFNNLSIFSCALADQEKQGWLRVAASGELNSIGEQGDHNTGEPVAISSLDAQARLLAWPEIDFVKIDAEGQEARIVAGAREFFAQQSPLVMFEIKHGGQRNDALRWMFQALGYQSYRLMGDGSCLIAVESDEELDEFQLNLFAAKPDRTKALVECGLLIESASVPASAFELSAEERAEALRLFVAQPFARAFNIGEHDLIECPFAQGLVAYAAFLYLGLPPGRRHAALLHADAVLSGFDGRLSSSAALSTHARIALDLGHRYAAVAILTQLLSLPDAGIDHAFFPAAQRFEAIGPADGSESDWFVAAVTESLELNRTYSSRFDKTPSEGLEQLLTGAFASAAMTRRAIVSRLFRGIPVGSGEIQRLLNISPRNKALWRALQERLSQTAA